jgi:DNA-binding response OmpR family regulator
VGPRIKGSRSQPTLLVVEDDEALRFALAALLVREGYLVLTAATARDALATLRWRLEPVEVVILDVRLPDVGGAELCARLRELYPHLPVIVCTGEATPGEARGLLALGVRRYFRKPVSPDELLAAIEATRSRAAPQSP